MKPEDFEQKLQRQPMRQVPGDWRAEILAAASAAGAAHRAVCGRRSVVSLPNWLSTLLWPHPVAWAGLAAIWIFIFAVNFSIRDQVPVMAEKSTPPSPEVIAALRQQQRLFAELIGANDSRVADRQKLVSPKPRSEFSQVLTA